MCLCMYKVKKAFSRCLKKSMLLNFMDTLYNPVILRNSDKQAGRLTGLGLNNLYFFNRGKE